MECPHCGRSHDKVIDSRLAKDGVTVRRRRQCLACSKRFTTYEATEEQLLPFLIGKNSGQATTTTNLRAMLSFLAETSEALSTEMEKLITRLEKTERDQALRESKKKARERKIAKRKAQSLMMAEAVLKVIRRHRRGIDIARLKEKTSFDTQRINAIVFELRRQGKIKSLRRGFYVKP